MPTTNYTDSLPPQSIFVVAAQKVAASKAAAATASKCHGHDQ